MLISFKMEKLWQYFVTLINKSFEMYKLIKIFLYASSKNLIFCYGILNKE